MRRKSTILEFCKDESILYTDDRTRIPGQGNRTYSDLNSQFQMEATGTNVQPVYAIFDCQGNYLNLVKGYQLALNQGDYLPFFQEGVRRNPCKNGLLGTLLTKSSPPHAN